ncbi:MAG TPA: universal stress protein [Gemmataceae bacterium]|jgi:nucleotide-binding universal stress UspA family protein
MYRSFLVPLDGSLPSEQALHYATALARRSGAALHLAYVHSPLLLGEGAMYLGTPDVQLWEEEKKYLQGVVNRLKKAGVANVRGTILEGPIVESLQEHALNEKCDLVVMTTHGRGPVSRFWLGSVADQLVHRLPIPLLLIRTREEALPPAKEPEIRNILVALDGTPAAEQILEPVGELARLVDASCTLLRVVPAVAPPNEQAKQYGWTYDRVEPEVVLPSEAPAPTGSDLADKLRAEAHVYLRRMAGSLRERGIHAQERIIASDHPATAILNESADREYDLLALETHGRHGLPRLFLGSVADKVVRGASLPVLVHRCLPG